MSGRVTPPTATAPPAPSKRGPRPPRAAHVSGLTQLKRPPAMVAAEGVWRPGTAVQGVGVLPEGASWQLQDAGRAIGARGGAGKVRVQMERSRRVTVT